MPSNRIKIAFILPASALPVPAVKGGAIETLMTMLLEENEKHGCFQFVFIFPDLEDKVTAFKYTRCYACSAKKQPDLDMKSLTAREYPYDYKASLITKDENVDYVIMEGAALRIHNCFENVGPVQRRAIHLHHSGGRSGIYKEAFGITIAPSRFVGEKWNEEATEDREKTYILQNCIKTERFLKRLEYGQRCEMRKKAGFSEDDFVVLFCGRLIWEKGVRELLEAVLSISDESVKLLLIGSDSFADGNRKPYAQQIVKATRENKARMRYLGYIENQSLPDYYQCADMQAVPSLWEEAAGLVLLEGMCSGLPLLITRSGGMTEYVTKQTGVLVDRDMYLTRHLSEGILWLKEHPMERRKMARLGVERAKQYSAENYYKQFCKMMEWWLSFDKE